MAEGVDGLLREKSRPPGTPKTPDERTAGVIRPTPSPPPHEATHRTLRAMGTLRGWRPRRCTGFGRRMVRRRTAGGCSSSCGIRLLSRNCTVSWGFTSALLRTQWCSRWMKSRKFRRWTECNPTLGRFLHRVHQDIVTIARHLHPYPSLRGLRGDLFPGGRLWSGWTTTPP